MRRLLSPGHALMLVGAGHAAWGIAAYREQIRELTKTGVADSVGDGLFRTAHARDARAAAFWFLFSAPLICLSGYLAEAALRAGERRAVTVAGRTVLALGAVGAVVMPRSGFVIVPPLGWWLMRCGSRDEPGRGHAPER